MSEPVFIRVKRVIANGVETAVEKAERASGPLLMREAARELDRTESRLRTDRDAALARRDRAGEAQQAIRSKLAELADHARYALSKDREDLARVALSRQIDLEAELEMAAKAQAEAKIDARHLDGALVDLAARKKQMAKELAAIRREQHAVAPRTKGESVQAKVTKAMGRADEMLDRALAERGAAAGEPVDVALKLADIEAMRRDDAIEDRLAAMKSKAAPVSAKKKPAKKRG